MQTNIVLISFKRFKLFYADTFLRKKTIIDAFVT